MEIRKNKIWKNEIWKIKIMKNTARKNKKKRIEILQKVFCIPPVPSLIVAVPSYIMVISVLRKDVRNPFIADLSFVMASYALVVTVIWAVKALRWIRPKMADMPFIKKILIVLCIENT